MGTNALLQVSKERIEQQWKALGDEARAIILVAKEEGREMPQAQSDGKRIDWMQAETVPGCGHDPFRLGPDRELQRSFPGRIASIFSLTCFA